MRKRRRREKRMRRSKSNINNRKFWEELVVYFLFIRHRQHREPEN